MRGEAEDDDMPVYEYWCTRCRMFFEVVQSLAEHGRHRPGCPKCSRSDHVERRLSDFTAITSHKS